MKVIFATQNQNKFREIQTKVKDSLELVSLADLGFKDELEETGRTLEANATQKARFVFEKFGIPAFSDDSGLEVGALNGEPGVDSAHYSGARDSDANMDMLLKKLVPFEDRTARFRTVIAYCDQNGVRLFQGEVKGKISTQKQGKKGFGYDPIFIPDGLDRSFAEMDLEEKSSMSHRSHAFESFYAEFLKKG